MNPLNLLNSACRFCRYYEPEGRRGGMCQQLGAPVQGRWKACALALPTFAPSWEGFGDMMTWSKEMPVLPSSSSLVSALDISQPGPDEEIARLKELHPLTLSPPLVG